MLRHHHHRVVEDYNCLWLKSIDNKQQQHSNTRHAAAHPRVQNAYINKFCMFERTHMTCHVSDANVVTASTEDTTDVAIATLLLRAAIAAVPVAT